MLMRTKTITVDVDRLTKKCRRCGRSGECKAHSLRMGPDGRWEPGSWASYPPGWGSLRLSVSPEVDAKDVELDFCHDCVGVAFSAARAAIADDRSGR